MISDIINLIEDTIEMHKAYMINSQKWGLQGLKRFNRYESVENLKRANKLKNYITEFEIEEYSRSAKMPIKQVNSYNDMIDNIIDNRKKVINEIEHAYKESSDISFCEMLTEINNDFKKELETFRRIKRVLSYYADDSVKKKALFEWDYKMHEHIKSKEDK